MPQDNSQVGLGKDGMKIISWNVKGLNQANKRKRVLSHLKHLDAGIAFLQETHLLNRDQLRIRKDWVGEMFHSQFNYKSRGVAILIHKKIPFHVSKTILDPNGRYVIVVGKLFQLSLVLVNIYGPNFDDDIFFKKILSTIPNLDSHHLIMSGDYNLVLDSVLDRSAHSVIRPSKSTQLVQSFIDIHKLVDPWRFKHPTKRDYSYYSTVHKSFSRIDFFLVDPYLLDAITDCKYDSIIISDHAPVSIKVTLPTQRIKRTWQLDTLLLADSDFVKFITDEIDFFLQVNRTGDISASTLWEALKAYLRGQIISRSSYIRKKKYEKVDELSSEIKTLDSLISISSTPDLIKRRLSLQTEIDLLTSSQAEGLILKSRSRFYEEGDKAFKLLASQLRQKAASRNILQIMLPNGSLTEDHRSINNCFKEYYSKLYLLDIRPDVKDFDNFFSNLNVPTINSASKERLEKNITLEEIHNGITSLQGGKAPGPDGFPTDFYKKFKDKIAPLLVLV